MRVLIDLVVADSLHEAGAIVEKPPPGSGRSRLR